MFNFLGEDNIPAYQWCDKEIRMKAIKYLPMILMESESLGIKEIRVILNAEKSRAEIRGELFKRKGPVMDFLDRIIPKEINRRRSLIGFLMNVIVPELPYSQEELDSVFTPIEKRRK